MFCKRIQPCTCIWATNRSETGSRKCTNRWPNPENPSKTPSKKKSTKPCQAESDTNKVLETLMENNSKLIKKVTLSLKVKKRSTKMVKSFKIKTILHNAMSLRISFLRNSKQKKPKCKLIPLKWQKPMFNMKEQFMSKSKLRHKIIQCKKLE